MGRIKRLLVPGRRTPTFVEGFIVALVVLAGLGVVSVSAARPPENKTNLNAPLKSKGAGTAREPMAALPAERTAHYFQWADSTNRRSDVIIVKDKKGNVVELYVDGRRIPDKEIVTYRQRIEQALAEQNKNRYSDAPERDVNTALRRMEETGEKGERWTIYGDPDAVPPPSPPVPPVAPVPAVPPLPPFTSLGEFDEGFQELEESLRSTMDNLQEFMQKINIDFMRQQLDLNRELNRVNQELEKIGSGNNKEREKLEKQRSNFEERLQELQLNYQEDRAKAEVQVRKAQAELDQKRAEMERSLQSQQQAMQETQARLNEKVQAQHEAAMRVHAEEMKEHEAQMKVHESQMKKHEAFMKVLDGQLKKDGFLEGNGDIEFKMENGQLYINEKLQPAEVYEKYLKLFKAHGQTPSRFHWKSND